MQAAREQLLRFGKAAPLGAALLIMAGTAAAQSPAAFSREDRLVAWAVVIFLLLLFLTGAWLLLRRLAEHAGTLATAPRFLELPLGAPEGSVRALVSVFIIVFGFMLLALQGPLGLSASEAVTGFLGTVITFYFASRNAEQSRQMVERATAAAESAGAAAETAVRNTATPAAAAPEAARLATLRDAQGKLQALRGLVAVAGSLGVGTGALGGADRALARVDGLLGRIAPVLGGGANAETIGRLAEEAAGALKELGDLGPVGHAVSDAMATVGRVAAQSTPIANALGGLFGGGAVAGPAGLVAAVVVGGLQLVKEKEKFDRWKAAMLDTPLDLGLLPSVVDAGLAAAALRRAPILAEKLAPAGSIEPALALSVWEAVGTVAGRAPIPAREAAVAVIAGAPGEGAAALRQHFGNNAEALSDAIEDLRTAMTGAAALAGLGLERLAVGGAEIATTALAGAVRTARQDSRVAAEIERMVYLVEALGKADPAMLEAVSARLGAAEFLRGAEAEAAAKTRAAAAASTEGG